MAYTNKAKTLYHDCDVNNRLKISATMRYMQQASGDHMESLGLPAQKLLRENMVFMLSATCLKVNMMPVVSQEILVRTAPTAVKGARFVREFAIDSTAGERLISAVTLWLLIDPESRKILRPASFPYDLPIEPSFAGDINNIATPNPPVTEESPKMSIDVRYSHLDCNNHVSNSNYADFICDMLPYTQLVERGVDTFSIHFQNEAKLGQTLDIERAQISDAEHYLRGKSQENACFEAFVKFNAI